MNYLIATVAATTVVLTSFMAQAGLSSLQCRPTDFGSFWGDFRVMRQDQFILSNNRVFKVTKVNGKEERNLCLPQLDWTRNYLFDGMLASREGAVPASFLIEHRTVSVDSYPIRGTLYVKNQTGHTNVPYSCRIEPNFQSLTTACPNH